VRRKRQYFGFLVFSLDFVTLAAGCNVLPVNHIKNCISISEDEFDYAQCVSKSDNTIFPSIGKMSVKLLARINP
jgi:hypothetical protein